MTRIVFIALIFCFLSSSICLTAVSADLQEEEEEECRVDNNSSTKDENNADANYGGNSDDNNSLVDADDNVHLQNFNERWNRLWNIHKQVVSSPTTQNIIESTYSYMMKEVYSPSGTFSKSKSIIKGCKNQKSQCSHWASIGECDNNPGYMQTHCGPACQTCHQLDIKYRCAYNDTMETKAWQQNRNDLNDMFLNILHHPYYQQVYTNITVHSRPMQQPDKKKKKQQELENNNTQSNQQQHDMAALNSLIQQSLQQVKPKQPTRLYSRRYHFQSLPWVLTIDNFLTNEECDAIIDHGTRLGYKPSNVHSGEDDKNTNENPLDGTYAHYQSKKDRSSTNTWCTTTCYQDPILQTIHKKMENLTGIPKENYEFLQLLRYGPTQLYGRHHDYLPYLRERQPGVRILTVYIYLNDEELIGGETSFPELGITVQPKKGTILLWPNVLNDDPDEKDPLTDHEALPVIKGVKYGVNAWVHQRNYKEPHSRGCSG